MIFSFNEWGIKMYQIQEEQGAWLCLIRTTLETCTDVVYETMEEFHESNPGWQKLIGYDTLWFYRLNEIQRRCAELKNYSAVAVIDFPQIMLNHFAYSENNKFFRNECGFRFSKTKGGFMKVKSAKVKPVSVSNRLLSELRVQTAYAIGHILDNRYGIDLRLKCCNTKSIQSGMIKLFMDIGGVEKDILNPVPFDSVYDSGSRKYTSVTLRTYVESKVSADLVEATIAEWSNWFNSHKK